MARGRGLLQHWLSPIVTDLRKGTRSKQEKIALRWKTRALGKEKKASEHEMVHACGKNYIHLRRSTALTFEILLLDFVRQKMSSGLRRRRQPTNVQEIDRVVGSSPPFLQWSRVLVTLGGLSGRRQWTGPWRVSRAILPHTTQGRGFLTGRGDLSGTIKRPGRREYHISPHPLSRVTGRSQLRVQFYQ